MNILTDPNAFEIRSNLRDEYGRILSEWSLCSAAFVLWETRPSLRIDNVEWRLRGDETGAKTPNRAALADFMNTIC